MQSLAAQEKAVFNFYLWEYQYRGYEIHPFPVALNHPYIPFTRNQRVFENGYDDGRVPSLLKRVFKKEVQDQPSNEPVLPISEPVERNSNLVVLIIQFPFGSEISPNRSLELLSSLSSTHFPVSFEIIGTGDNIRIQLTCNVYDELRVRSHLSIYFPDCHIKEGEQFNLPFDPDGSEIAVIDFGLEQEFMLPIQISDHFGIDPLTPLFALLESLPISACAIFQVIIKGVDSPLAHDIMYSVHNGKGDSFFEDFPEITNEARVKINSPLISCSVRLSVQGNNRTQTSLFAQEFITTIQEITRSEYNQLFPLSNEGYDYDQHVMNVFYRSSNRHGMILSVNELLSVFHYPNNTIVSPKLIDQSDKTKPVSPAFTHKRYLLGINHHDDLETEVSFDDEMRLRHTHILGVTGVGKSTLQVNLMLQDIKIGNGCALFDPHGDIVDDILLRIPEERKEDVILIDPSDTDFPIGFNLLHATTEAEKLVLSSDLVSAFRSHSTAWGDTMTSVLSNTIDTFLNSSTGGTLIELKRFLLDDQFRSSFLQNVDDASLKYYWSHEFGMVKKRISPLLTRIDTFLRPKIIRMMMAQKNGIDFRKAIEEKKILLFKLSLGLIGEENAYLLGSLFLSKLNQVALGRQSLEKDERHPYYIYLDECQHFMSPSIGMMLSGVRKYGIGLTLAHQDLSQIEHTTTLNSILSNPFTRICFRLGDNDAKSLASGFSYFDTDDLTSLNRGQTIVRIGSRENDFNVCTSPLSEDTNNTIKEYIITHTRNTYARPKEEIEKLINQQFETKPVKPEPISSTQEEKPISPLPTETIESASKESEVTQNTEVSEEAKNAIIQREERNKTLREHRKLQSEVKKLGQEYGFRSSIEKQIDYEKRIDVSLEREDINIACEISVTNTAKYEVSNITKCLDAQYDLVLVISDNEKHLSSISRLAQKSLSVQEFKQTLFISSSDLKTVLESCKIQEPPSTEVIKGFRVKTEFDSSNTNDANRFRKNIERILKKKR